MQNVLKDNKILFMVKYGSYNYNLNTSNSDVDWRGFSNNINYKNVLNFEYNNNDICINNTMDLYISLVEMTPKFIELLYSDTVLISENISNKTKLLIDELFNLKDFVTVMNLSRMYENYLNDFYIHQNWITENKKPSHNINYAIHSYRILDILYKFAYSDFRDYKSAIYYSDDNTIRSLIINIKTDSSLLPELERLTKIKLEKVIKSKPYFNKKVDVETIKNLENIIKNISLEVVR